MKIANLSYHNTRIILDTCRDDLHQYVTAQNRCGVGISALIDMWATVYADRLTLDKCGNITHIDGRKVLGGDLVYTLAETPDVPKA